MDDRHRSHHPAGLRAVLPHLLRSEQLHTGAGGRFRRPRGAEGDREALLADSIRRGAAAGRERRAGPEGRAAGGDPLSLAGPGGAGGIPRPRRARSRLAGARSDRGRPQLRRGCAAQARARLPAGVVRRRTRLLRVAGRSGTLRGLLEAQSRNRSGPRRELAVGGALAPLRRAGACARAGSGEEPRPWAIITRITNFERAFSYDRADGIDARHLAGAARSARPLRGHHRRRRPTRRAQDLRALPAQRGHSDSRRGREVTADVALPPLAIEKLPSGLTLLALQKRGLPLFHARLSVPAGACEDPRGKAGLAQFTVDLLRRGTRRRPAQDVDDLIESMGAQLSADVSMEEAALALTVPAELSERALDALLEVALEPAFDEGEVGAARRRTVAALQSDLDEPSAVAGRAVVSMGYGPGHPYAHPGSGWRRDVETFRPEDARGFHATRYQQSGALF